MSLTCNKILKCDKCATSLRLTPLDQDFEVNVQITGTITTNYIITVNARSQEDANAIVMFSNDYREDMNQKLEYAVIHGYFDDISVELN